MLRPALLRNSPDTEFPLSPRPRLPLAVSFFFHDTATPEIYTLSLHDALPISGCLKPVTVIIPPGCLLAPGYPRSEEHTSELQSLRHLVCRLLLEKKKCGNLDLIHKIDHE